MIRASRAMPIAIRRSGKAVYPSSNPLHVGTPAA
jgi:hypothetical protein